MQAASESVPGQNSGVTGRTEAPTLMRLRYGFNLGDDWHDLSAGPARDLLIARIRNAATERVRVFLEPAGRPADEYWQACVRILDAITRAGAIPMIAIPNPASWSDAHAIQAFAARCGELVDRCGEQWGSPAVASWFWSIGDEPNSPWTNGGLTFERYRDIYQAAAGAILRRVGALDHRPRIGGPCVDGFQPFWFDWIYRFAEEVDDALVGFVAWNRYGDWREPGAWGAPADPRIFESLLLSRTGEYWSRAEAIRTHVEGRGILNICSELNAHSHADPDVSRSFNQGMFGAAYYGSALIELMRGGADGELLWAGACDGGTYGALAATGETTPAYEAKQLIAQHVRFGDSLSFPIDADPEPDLEAVVASDGAGPRVAVLVHRSRRAQSFDLTRWPALAAFSQIRMMSGEHAGPVHRDLISRLPVAFDGYSVALLHD